MTDKEAMKLALDALEAAPTSWRAPEAQAALRQAIEQAEKQEPVTLRRGDVLRCIETDELCTVWATSATHKTLVKWSGNDFSDYTAEQIGELFWLEPESSDVEIAAEQSDNYAAFHAGVRFARAHSLATPKQEEVEIDWPDYHEQAMGCGLEDRGITNRYEAMRYGWDEALDKAVEAVNLLGPLYTHPPQRTEHITDGSPCWCEPELDYKDPDTGAEVWIHRETQ